MDRDLGQLEAARLRTARASACRPARISASAYASQSAQEALREQLEAC